MWEVEKQEEMRTARLEQLHKRDERLRAAGIPLDRMERMRRATRQCQGDLKCWTSPPRDVYCQDCAGKTMKRQIDLRDFPGVTNDWLNVIASHAVSLGRVQLERCIALDVSGTGISDIGLTTIATKLKFVTTLNVSRCSALSDDGLTSVRRHLSQLQTLSIDECRRFSSDVLCQTWKDRNRLRALSAVGCPGVTDRLLQCVASSPRVSLDFSVRSLDVRQCKNVTSSGIAALASSSRPDVAIECLRCGDCMNVDAMAFFGFEDSAALSMLAELDLRGLAVDETAISWIAKGCASSRRLRRLNLARCKLLTDFALLLLAPVAACPSFEKLNLEDCALLTDTGIQNLLSAPVSKGNTVAKDDSDEEDEFKCDGVSLRSLNLRNCVKVGDGAMQVIGARCPQLTRLDLKGLRKVSDRGVLALAKGCPRLAKLVLSGRHVSTQTFVVLGKMCRALTKLDVSERRDLESPICFLHLTRPPTCGDKAGVSQLQYVDLAATNVCDVGVSVLAVSCRQLQWLSLCQCVNVTDAAVEALASSCVALRVLLLAHVRRLTDRALAACARSELPLQALDLSGNTSVTDAAVRALCAACRDLRDLRLHGCDRLSRRALRSCAAELLPLTQPLAAAGGGDNAGLQLCGLPKAHAALLSTLEREFCGALTLQTRFRRWRRARFSVQFLAQRRVLRESRAAAKIQRCVRAFLSWRGFLHLLHAGKSVEAVVLVQARARGLLARKEVAAKRRRESRAATKIQRCYRPHFAARMRVHGHCAREVQRVFRGFKARRYRDQLVLQRRESAASRIARWFRGCRRQQHMRERSRWLVRKVRSLQSQWRVHVRRKRLRAHVGYYRRRAVKIQSAWRRKLAGLRVAALRERATAAATAIQRVFRGHAARKWARRHRAEGGAAATRIQSHWRRYAGRSAFLAARVRVVRMQRMARYALAVRKARSVVRGAVDRHRQLAARELQRAYRGHLGRRRAALFRKIRSAKAARKGQHATHALLRRRFVRRGAALRVQRWIRAVLARRRMLKLRRWRQFLAASRVQRYLRRWMQRLRVRRRREAQSHAALAIERVFRGHRGRVRVHRERHAQRCQRAALAIQRVFRGHRGRAQFRAERRASHAAARMLQRAFRGRQARKLYEISLAVKALRAKEQYDRSLLGWLDAQRNPMDELYRRARLPRERAVLAELLAKWSANRGAEERALRKTRREGRAGAWPQADELAGNALALRRKLFGVTENVYATRQELLARQQRRAQLEAQLRDRRASIAAFRRELADAVAAKRMLEGAEVLALLEAHGLAPTTAATKGD